jgi:acyl-coenzyme A synthetase/AMP-(fatty) acid ligase
VLQSHPAVEQAAVISRADDDGIEHVEAHVVLAPDAQASEQDLREWLLSRVDKHACPSPILLVDNLPRTDTGKVQRHVLRGNPLTY